MPENNIKINHNYSKISSIGSTYGNTLEREGEINQAMAFSDLFAFLEKRTKNERLKKMFRFLQSDKGHVVLLSGMLLTTAAATTGHAFSGNNTLASSFSGSIISYSLATSFGLAISQTKLKKYFTPIVQIPNSDETEEQANVRRRQEITRFIILGSIGLLLAAGALAAAGVIIVNFPLAGIASSFFAIGIGMVGGIGTQMLTNNFTKLKKSLNLDDKISDKTIANIKKIVTLSIAIILSAATIVALFLSGVGPYILITTAVFTGISILRPIITNVINSSIESKQLKEIKMLDTAALQLLQQKSKELESDTDISKNSSPTTIDKTELISQAKPSFKNSYMSYLKNNAFGISTCIALTVSAPILLGIGAGLGAPVIAGLTVAGLLFTSALVLFNGLSYAKQDYNRIDNNYNKQQALKKVIDLQQHKSYEVPENVIAKGKVNWPELFKHLDKIRDDISKTASSSQESGDLPPAFKKPGIEIQ